MQRVYRGLLRLYPTGFIREFGEEMLWVFCRAQEEARRGGLKAQAVFFVREIWGVLAGAMYAQLRYGGWNRFRRFHMRSDFRFPRTTLVLMTLILGAVSLATRRGLGIAAMANAPERWTSMLLFFLWVCALLCALASGGYAILFALRRSGSHRLSNADTWQGRK
jgi:hypothetical protein